MRRLAALRGPKGEVWLSAAERGAAGMLRADFGAGESGLVRGSDWMAADGIDARRVERTGIGNGAAMRLARWCR